MTTQTMGPVDYPNFPRFLFEINRNLSHTEISYYNTKRGALVSNMLATGDYTLEQSLVTDPVPNNDCYVLQRIPGKVTDPDAIIRWYKFRYGDNYRYFI